MEINNESILKNRVGKVFKELKISANELQRATGISHSTISSQVNGKSKLAASTIVALLQYNNSISAEWLMRGEGEMLNGSKSNHTSIIPTSNDERTMNERLDNEDIAQLKDTISRQQREIDGLYERIGELKGTISYLKKENAVTDTVHTA